MEQAPKRKLLYVALGLTVTGIVGFFGYNYYQKHKQNNTTSNADFTEDSNTNQPVFTPPLPITTNSNFPLQKGSKGEKVKAIQLALIQKYGVSILPQYGADGDFGTEMQNALIKSKLPISIDESTYNLIVKGAAPESNSITQVLIKSITTRNFNQVLATLKQMRNTNDYSKISTQFKTYRVNGVHQTLVNGLLNSFSEDEKKQQIRMELLRMGLKYDGNKWSLNGVDGLGYLPQW